jgi:hypothetical protein
MNGVEDTEVLIVSPTALGTSMVHVASPRGYDDVLTPNDRWSGQDTVEPHLIATPDNIRLEEPGSTISSIHRMLLPVLEERAGCEVLNMKAASAHYGTNTPSYTNLAHIPANLIPCRLPVAGWSHSSAMSSSFQKSLASI